MKWKRHVPGLYESGPWIIEKHDGYPHPQPVWAIYHDRVFVGQGWTLADAKQRAAVLVSRLSLKKGAADGTAPD
jgi:hypothetical protein